MKKQIITSANRIQNSEFRINPIRFWLLASVFCILYSSSFSQNNALVLDGAYIVLDGGTVANPIYIVVGQSNTAGIVRLSGGGHIVSEGQYNYVKWNSGTGTGNYIYPFGVGAVAADYVPFTFDKTTAGSADISISTWTTNPQNMPHPAISNVPAVSNMIGIPDSVKNAIDRFWDIQSPAPVTADLTFSYRGAEIPAAAPTDTFKAQHWNGATWDIQAGPGNPGVTFGIGTVGPIPGQTTFSPWVLTRAGLSVSVTATQAILCNSQCTGTAAVSISGGSPSYTFLWTPSGQTTQTATGLCAATYSILVTDAAGSTAINTVTITQPAAITASLTATAVLCNGGNNGSATVLAAGGTPSYIYLWNPSAQTSATATGLSSGNYTTTITDANGCTQTNTVTVSQPTALTASTTATAASCSASDGTATANPSGGTPSYTYNWSTAPVQTTTTATGLSAGTYTVIVTDASGCTQTQTVTITSVNTLSVSTSSTQAGCALSNGTATATPNGGTAPYTYLWLTNPVQTTPTISNIPAGNYTCIITDANGCTQTTIAVVTTTSVTAYAGANATITAGNSTVLTATGGGTYSWNTGATSNSITVSPTITTEYCVYVTDNNCIDSACITIYVEIPCTDLYIPNAFSPNNDGKNDILYVRGNCIKEMRLIIYNRWGEKVFEYSGPEMNSGQGWDGMYNGKKANTGVFVYTLEATLRDNTPFTKKGNISLIR